jgi:hypothetical protein
MEQQNELTTPIGTEESINLKPSIVKIVEVNLEEVGQKKAKKLICQVKHPEAEQPIKISSVKWENKGKLEVSGLWFNTDSKKQIRKGSALATFLIFMKSETISQLVNKECQTTPDENNYLVFKGY